MEKNVDIAIIGAGSAGLYALSTVRSATTNFLLINGGQHGTTCARVGCMPSKVLIQVAEDYHRRHHFTNLGIQGADQLRIDIPSVMQHVRKLRDGFVNRVLNGAIAHLQDKIINGYAEFVEPTVLKVENQYIRAKKIIIATGSTPFVPKAWAAFKDQILTTDDLFEQTDLLPKMAVLGLGIIGLEIGQALHRLGIEITGMDLLHSVAGIKDPEINQIAIELFQQEFPLWLGETAELERHGQQLLVRCGQQSITVDKVLASLGRVPNITNLGIEKLGVKLDARGIPEFNPYTMQIDNLPIFIAGDVNGDRPILHEAGDEGRIAGFNAGQETVSTFKRKTKLSITFTDPNIISVGKNWAALENHTDVAIGKMDFKMQGRALIMSKNKGMIRIYGEKSSGKLLGAEMIVPQGEHLGHLLAWSIQQDLTVFDLLKMPFYHPVIEEGLQNALYDLRGQITTQPTNKIIELDIYPN